MKGMKKRLLSLVLCLVMVFSLLPFAGMAAQEPVTANGATVTNPDTAYSTRRDLSLSKTLTANDDGTFDLQLESYATGKVTTKVVTTQTPTDFVFVVDQSGSMSYKDMPLGYEAVTDKTTWKMSDIPASDSSSGSTDGAYYYKDPTTGDYYRVYKKWGAMYEQVPRNSVYLKQLIDTNSLSWFRDAGEQTQSFDSMYYYQPSTDPLINNSYNPDKDLANDDHFYPLTMTVENAPLYYFMTFAYKDVNGNDRTMKYYYNPNEQSTDKATSNAIWYYNSVDGDFYPGRTFARLNYNYINRVVVYAAGEGQSPVSALISGTFSGSPDTGFYNRYTYAEFLGATTGMYVQNVMYIGHVGYHELCYRDANGVEHYLIQTPYCDANDTPLSTPGGSEATWNGTLYRVAGTANGAPQTESRLQALNTSLKAFVDEVAGQTDSEGNVRHRIAIVGFSSDNSYNNNEILSGVDLTSPGTMSSTPNTTNGYSLDGRSHNGVAYSNSLSQDTYSGALVDTATADRVVDQTKVDSLKDSVDAITAYGGTQPEIGFAMAQKIIEARNAKDPTAGSRNTVVIFFTDGRPGNHSYDDQYAEANEVVLAAKGVKNLGATVYSVGVFNEADGNPLTYRVQSNLYTLDAVASIRNRECGKGGLHTHLFNSNKYLRDGYSVYQVQQELLSDGYELEQKSSNGKFVQEYRTNYVRKESGSTGSVNTGTWYWGNNDHYANNVYLSYYVQYFYYRDCVESTYGYPDQPNDTIADYMTTVSSTYKSASSFDGGWSTNPGSNYTTAINNARGSREAQNYYMLATNADRLKEVFVTISQDVDVSGTTVNLNDKAELQDVVNSDAFVVPAKSQVEVWTQPMIATENGDSVTYAPTGTATKNDALTNAVVVDADGTVHVSGFDYEHHYVMPNPPAETTPMKLIVKIKGLTPTNEALSSTTPMASNNRAGIYAGDDSGVSTIPSVEVKDSPTFTFSGATNPTFVIDYNANMQLATEAKQMKGATSNNGSFDLSNEKVTYQLTTQAQSDKTAVINTAYDDVDTALVYGKPEGAGSVAWNQITTVPASSVYFDDSLTNQTLTVGDGSGSASIDSNVAKATTDASGAYYFTFYGTGIDVYCTTHTGGGYVSAAVFKTGDPTNCNTNTRIKDETNKAITVKNQSSTDRYNTPTVSFTGLTADTYTVKISANNAAYKLDGVRVYNPVQSGSAAETTLNQTDEANATYLNLRALLLNAESGFSVTQPDGMSGAVDTATISGVLFVDEADKIVTTYHDENGNDVQKYSTQFDVYKANGPKGEIYLSNNQAITFQLNTSKVAPGSKVWIGLSAPETGSGTVTITGKDGSVSVNSVMDMYYDFTVPSTGSVTITNTGSSLISVTNLKVTGVAGLLNVAAPDSTDPTDVSNSANSDAILSAKRAVFAPVTLSTVRMAANNGVDPEATVEEPETPDVPDTPDTPDTPDEPDTPDQPDDPKPGWSNGTDVARQILSSFLQSLMNSMKKLFGGLGGW